MYHQLGLILVLPFLGQAQNEALSPLLCVFWERVRQEHLPPTSRAELRCIAPRVGRGLQKPDEDFLWRGIQRGQARGVPGSLEHYYTLRAVPEDFSDTSP